MSIYKTMAMEMARYNRWQNDVLFGLCDSLGEDVLPRDRGAFFRSLHATLNHILHVDRVLMTFIIAGKPPEAFDATIIPYEDYRELRTARVVLDNEILEQMDSAAPQWFEVTFEFYSEELSRNRCRPRALFINQMFNHQTHHRAQATFMLHQLGLGYGSTDMPYNPLSQS